MDTKAPTLLADWLKSQERSASWLGRRCGAAPSTVLRWIGGEQIPQYHTRKVVAHITGLPIANEEAWR